MERAGGRPRGGFVDADHVAAITATHIRCDLDRSGVGLLQPPQGAPTYYANPIDQAQTTTVQYVNGQYGTMFRRAHWTREQ